MMVDVPDPAVIATIGGIIAGFGATILMFRLQRELQMQDRNEIVWVARADWLVVLATFVCLIFVLPPLSMGLNHRLLGGLTGGSAILIGGYVFAILAHYRLLPGTKRSGPRENPEPAERLIILSTLGCAALFVLVSTLHEVA